MNIHIFVEISNRILNMKYLLGLLFLFCLIEVEAISSGLYFKSHDYIKENRTSLDLTPEKKFNFGDGFSLSFDIRLREEFHNYGYIFRIISNDSTCFDLISNFNEQQRSLSLVEGSDIFLPFDQNDLYRYQMESWVPVKFQYTPSKKEISIAFNGSILKEKIKQDDLTNFRIVFGSCYYKDFISADVPPMSIRNIRLKNHQEKEKAYWPLREHHFNEVYDSISNRIAFVKNPIWEIDRHIKWVKKAGFQTSDYAQVTYDEKNGALYIADIKYLLKYNLRENKTDSILPLSGNVFYEVSNQIIYNPFYHQIWAYDFYKPHIIYYDFEKNCWSHSDEQIKNPTHSQHNAFISPVDSSLYTYGGYGDYTYKDDILKKKKNDDVDWEKISYTPHIPARYLSGMGFKSKDTLLVFGGCGTPSGKQEMGIINYYDLYSIDIKDFNVNKIWTLPKPTEDFVVSNAIIVDSELNRFFALCYPNDRSNSYIVLKSFDLTDGKSEVLADTIPFLFYDVTSFCTLYRDEEANMLYAVTKYIDSQKQAIINVYSLAYPPLNIQAVNQSVPFMLQYKTRLILFSILVIVFAIAFVLLIKFNKRKQKRKVLFSTPPVGTAITSITNLSIPEENLLNFSKPSTINFLGGFQVIDKNGIDITGSFTPTIKHILILIILYSVKNKKGASNVIFKDLLWPDKSEESSQNNRRVNIRKLKITLEELEGIELDSDNKYWSIKTNESFFCDYIRIHELMGLIKSESTLNITAFNEFLSLAARGQLLPYVQEDWSDPFKSEFTAELLNILMDLSKTPEIQENYKLIIRIADIIFIHDNTDEYALMLKCKALYFNGKKGLAKTTYDNYCSEYQTLLGSEYPKPFQDIVG